MRVYENRSFTKSVIVMDDARFIHCSFHSCTVKYSGAPYEIIDCISGPDTRWEFKHAAMRTAALMEQMGIVRPDGTPSFETPYLGASVQSPL